MNAPFPWIDVAIILVLIAVNGIFSMSELAIVSARPARLEGMARTSRGAATAIRLASDPGKFLSTVQIGITLIGIVAGAYSGSSLGTPVAQRLQGLFGLEAATAQTAGIALVIAITTYASLIVGELVPKQFALRSPEPIAAFMALPYHRASCLAARSIERARLPRHRPQPRIGKSRHGRGAPPARRRSLQVGRDRGA